MRELKEELGISESGIRNLSLRYVTLRRVKGEIRQNYYFFAMILLVGCGKSEDNTNINTELEKEADVNESSGIPQFRMTNAFNSDFELDYQNHYIMALNDVEVRGVPVDSIEPNRVLNYELVEYC